MSAVRRVPLYEVVSEPATWDPRTSASRHSIHYVDISSVNAAEKYLSGVKMIVPAEAPSRARQIVLKDDVLVSTVRPNLNAVAIVPPELDGATASTGFAVLRPDRSRLDARYLFHWVRSTAFIRHLTARATGASYPAVTERDIRESKIPLLNVDEQRNVAMRLDTADAIRRKQYESLQLLDKLLQSAFLEMFGDPAKNPKGWEIVPLGDLCEVQLGKMLSAKAHGGADPLPYLRNANVKWRRIDLSSVFQMDFSNAELAKFDLRAGDLLVCEGGEVGRCAIWEGQLPRCSFQKALHRLRPKDSRTRVEYLQELMYSLAHVGALAGAISRATIAHLTKIQLEQVRLPLPPEELQDRFVRVYRSIRQARERQELRLDHMNTLFDSLSQQAFQMQQ